jgi:hypothetical protein
MLYLKTIFLAWLYFASVALLPQFKCNNLKAGDITDQPISKITYNSSGGRSGNYESLDITADSIIYIQGHRGDEKSIREKTVKSFWDGLTKAINLKEFAKIKSNPGHALYDGIDITITIEKEDEKHSIVNGNEDASNYKKIRPFTDLLEKKLAELRKEIFW